MPNLHDLVIQAALAYTNGTPIMSDAEFDALERKLRAENPKDSYFDKVGATATGAFAKVTHRQLMGSLAKVQTVPEWVDWHAGHRHQGVLSEKLDGISVHLDWFEGRLKRASTRGDGEVGEDITRNVIRMKGVPRELPNLFTGETRGEIMCLKSDLKAHFPDYSNPRNTASGISKRQDGRGCEHLTVMCYQIFDYQGSKVQEFDHLKHLGFLTPTWYLANSSETVLAIYNQYNDGMRDELDYDIDGLVFEINDHDIKSRYGVQSKRPGGAIAFKFPTDQDVTPLLDVIWQTGTVGRVTPVSIFEAVELAGAQVSRASLANVRIFQELDLRLGDLVTVERRGDVIPKVLNNISTLEGIRGTPFTVPESCPSCEHPLIQEGEYLVCPDAAGCPAQRVGSVTRWCSGLDIKGWGEANVKALFDAGLINDVADCYTLDPKRAAGASSEGRVLGQSAHQMIDNLKAVTEAPLWKTLGLLGIPFCSTSTFRTVTEAGLDTLEKLTSASMADLTRIDGMGARRAEEMVGGLRRHADLIARLLGHVKPAQKAVGSMTGKSICLTGFRDAALQGAFERAGGTVKGSVGRGLTWLVTPDPQGGSDKLAKARTLGVEVISPAELRGMLS
jgi:DNA ligase (NAD+)